MSAPDGLKPFAGTGDFVGYQPSAKYWRTSKAEAAAIGVAIEVPLMNASWKLLHVADAEEVLQYLNLRWLSGSHLQSFSVTAIK